MTPVNKTLIILILIAILVIAGGGLFIASQKKGGSENSTMQKDESSITKEGSRYIEYSKATLDNFSSGRRVLYFYANWCPICRPADANFKANSDQIPEDLALIRVNYNDSDTDQEEKDLAKKYGITYQHTFVQIDENGNEIVKWSGGQIEELLANIK